MSVEDVWFHGHGSSFPPTARAEGREELPPRRPDRDSRGNNSEHTRSKPAGISHFRGRKWVMRPRGEKVCGEKGKRKGGIGLSINSSGFVHNVNVN